MKTFIPPLREAKKFKGEVLCAGLEGAACMTECEQKRQCMWCPETQLCGHPDDIKVQCPPYDEEGKSVGFLDSKKCVDSKSALRAAPADTPHPPQHASLPTIASKTSGATCRGK